MTTFVDIALLGVRVDAPVTRQMGAGPSDDGHLVVDGASAALPVNPHSPYQGRRRSGIVGHPGATAEVL
jgi:hypothetical protein